MIPSCSIEACFAMYSVLLYAFVNSIKCGKHVRRSIPNGNRMLKMSRCLPVSGGHCPTVAPEFHPWGAHVDHGFDRDHHSFLKFCIGSPVSKIGYGRASWRECVCQYV